MKYFLCFLLMLPVIDSQAAPAANSQPPTLPPILVGVHRIFTMGASITQFASRPGGYVWLIQRYLDALFPDAHIQVTDVGVSGNTSGDMVARFQKDVIDRGADMVTIKEGYNDLTRRFSNHPNGDGPGGADAAAYGKNMETMVEMAQKAGIRALVMTPTIYEDSPDSIRNQKLKDYTQSIRDVAARKQVPLADQYTALLQAWQEQRDGKHQRLTTDGVHLTLIGDAVLARTTLLAMGIRADQLNAVEPAVEAQVAAAAGK